MTAKNFGMTVLGWVVIAISLSLGFFGINAQEPAANIGDVEAIKAEMKKKVRPVDPARVPALEAKRAAAKSSLTSSATGGGYAMARPSFAFYSVGSTFTSLSVFAYNTRPLPDGTIMSAVKIVGGQPHPMGWNIFFGDFPEAIFEYPFDDGLRSTWGEGPSTIYYEVYTLFPDGSENFAYVNKPKSKNTFGPSRTDRLITGGNAFFTPTASTAVITGPIAEYRADQIGVLIKDPDLMFDQRVPEFRIAGGALRINLRTAWGNIMPGSDVVIMVVGPDGRTDQHTVTVKF